MIGSLLDLLRRGLRWLGLVKDIEGNIVTYVRDMVEAVRVVRNAYYKDVLPKITTKISYTDVISILNKWSDASPELFDATYYVPKKEIFRLIDKMGIQKFFEYRKEVFDCDDFSFAFKAYASEVFMINAVGIAIGTVTDSSGKVGHHAWNIVLVEENGEVVPYTVEPQTDQYAKGLKTKIGDWTYNPEQIIM